MEQNICTLCPRECKVDRNKALGFCKAPLSPTIAKVMLHLWEEPCICYGAGSGAVFFSGCQLKCVFCQNHKISCNIAGETLSALQLCDTFLSLQEKGACNINLVSPTPYLDTLIIALEKAKKHGLLIPVVMNSSGYEKADSIRALSGLVDIYLPDFKFADPHLSQNYANAPDYPAIALRAIEEMTNQIRGLLWDGDKLLRGVLVRHLILPGHSHDSIQILEKLANVLSPECIVLSLMRQYTPMHQANQFPNLTRRVTTMEYERVVQKAEELGFPYIYTQAKESATTAFVPDFKVN